MQLTCPGCGARYEIAADGWPGAPDATGARQLRPRRAHCHRCDAVWDALPDPPATATLADTASEWAEWDDFDPRPRRRWPWWSGGALVLLLGGFALDRAGIAHLRQLAAANLPTVQLPAVQLPEIRLPALRIALPRAAVPPLAVELAPLRPQPAGRNLVWEVQGSIHNPTAQPQPLPPVEIRLLDAHGRTVLRTLLRPVARELAPGARQAFATSLVDPGARSDQRVVRVRARLQPAELGRP